MTCLQELIAPAVLVSQNISENGLLGMEAEEILALQELGSWSEKDHSEWMVRAPQWASSTLEGLLPAWSSRVSFIENMVLGGKVLLKVLVSKSDSLSFLCRIYMVKEEIQLLQGLR